VSACSHAARGVSMPPRVDPRLSSRSVALDPARVVALQMDITNRFEVEAAGRAASDLRLLINNAGVA